MSKERNYAIEFYRFMFAINFIIIHGLMVFPLAYMGYRAPVLLGEQYYLFESGLDTILPFMIFAGYFLMNHFKKLQAKGLNDGVSPSRQAWTYLKQRIVGLLGIFLFAQLLGCVANGIWREVPASDWPVYILSCLGEFCGLQISGVGMGNSYVGNWGVNPTTGLQIAPTFQLCNTPLWFISGIFICGYFTYYFIAKDEKHYLGCFIPLLTILFFGMCWQNGTYGTNYMATGVPMWNSFYTIGDFTINMDLPLMFVGLGLGCIIWYAVDSLKGKNWSVGGKIFLTVVQLILTVLVLFRTWVPVNIDWVQDYCNFGWGVTWILSFFWCFLLLLNVDWITRCKIFQTKLWNIPGKLSLYIYMIHFPILVITGLAFGMKGMSPEGEILGFYNGVVPCRALSDAQLTKLYWVIGITVGASIIIGWLLMILDTKVIRPWLAKGPLFKKEATANGAPVVEAKTQKVNKIAPAKTEKKVEVKSTKVEKKAVAKVEKKVATKKPVAKKVAVKKPQTKSKK